MFLCSRSCFFIYINEINSLVKPRWRSWLRHCATSWKVAGPIPNGVIGIFLWHIPSGRTMVLGSTQRLTEMSTRNITWGYRRPVSRSDNLKTILSHCHVTWEPQIPGNLGASRASNKIALLYNKNQPVAPKPQINFILEWQSTGFRRVFPKSPGVQDCIYSKIICQTDTADCLLAHWCIWLVFLQKYINLLGLEFFF